MKVLVVEDDLHTRNIIEMVLKRDRMLRDQQMEVVCASDGAEGLELFRQHEPDLIITDLLMPKVDGFQLVEAVRREQGRPVAILVTSAIVRDRNVLSKLERDFDVQVQLKPFSPRVLAEQVQRLLARASDGIRTSPTPSDPVAAVSSRPVRLAERRTPAIAGVERGSLRQGDLAQTAVSALLLGAYEQQWSGTLDLRREKVQKVVYLLAGHPVFVQSSSREDALGPLLVQRGVIDERQHRMVLQLAQSENLRFGEALVRAGLMDESQVMDELVVQTTHKLYDCLRWRAGTWSFHEDVSVGAQVPRCTVDPPRVVFEGLRRRPDIEHALARLGPALDTTTRVVIQPRLSRYRENFAEAFGMSVLDRLGDGCLLAELRRLEPKQETAVQLEAMLATGMVTLSHQPAAPALSVASSVRSSVGGGSSADRVEGRLRRPAEAGPLRRVLSEARLDLSSLDKLSGQAVRRTPSRPVAAVSKARDGRAADVPANRSASAALNSETERLAQQLIASAYLGLHHKSHYEILGVIPDTDVNGIEVAYRIKRKQFDLDRYRELDLGEAYGHLEEICSALDHAFAVLSDAKRRRAYDDDLRTQQEGARRVAMDAEASYQRARDAMCDGRYEEALASLAQARRLHDEPVYRAEEAVARFFAGGQSPAAGQQAMMLVQQALASGVHHAAVHVAAATVSKGLGSVEEALQHLREAISLDPSHREAFDQIEQLLLEQQRYPQLEEEYRRTIYLLNNANRAWAGELWRRLAVVYRERLGDEQKAKLAALAAKKLDPDDGSVPNRT